MNVPGPSSVSDILRPFSSTTNLQNPPHNPSLLVGAPAGHHPQRFQYPTRGNIFAIIIDDHVSARRLHYDH